MGTGPAAGRSDLEALNSAAVNMGQTGNFGLKALLINTRILELSPDDLRALVRRGRCHRERDDFPAAKEDYLRALHISPGNAFVERELREIHAGWDAARERAEARFEREQARAEKERARAEEFRSVREITSFREALAVGIAAGEGETPDYAIAAVALERADELEPGRPGLLTRLARVYRCKRELDKAEETYRRALRLEDSRFAKVGLAAVLQDKDRPLEAKEMYREVLARYPDDAFALRGLGRTLASLGRYEEATEAFERAADAAEGPKDRNAAKRALAAMRKRFLREGDDKRARWVDSILSRLGASRTDPIDGPAW